MEKDNEGFKYARYDADACNHCGMCTRECPVSVPLKKVLSQSVYAVKNNNDNVRTNSSSGGMFSALATEVLNNNGAVYGAKFSGQVGNRFEVVHARITDIDDLPKLRGSKYVQSNLKNTFAQAKNDILNGKQVLYVGTPCQIAGLKAYLKHVNTDNLILVDFVCHGVVSPKVWKSYVDWLESYYDKKLKLFNFRYKKNGWHGSKPAATFYDSDKVYFDVGPTDAFDDLFYSNKVLRPSCHNCKFTNFDRVGDITLGDYWGIENVMPQFDDNKGTSVVLVNSTKGNYMFNNVKNSLNFIKMSNDQVYNNPLFRPTPVSSKRAQFWKDYNILPFNIVIKKHTAIGVKHKIIKLGKKMLKTTNLYAPLAKIVKKVLKWKTKLMQKN